MISISGYALHDIMRHKHNIDTYYALRLKDKCKVLLKTPNKQYASPENIAILQHEFQLLNMIEAPTIIKAYDFLQNNQVPVLVLENVKGQLLTSYLLMNQLEINDFFNLSLQLVDIIGELHQRNIIHKEINPLNIIINPENMILKLVDLSASTKLKEETFDYLKLFQIEEGLAYISPEQTGRINRPVDYRTDFYSLGIIFYEMLTNQLPFQTLDTLELIHCHIAKKPPPILEIRPDVPKMLVAIIDKLLGKMPEDRYSSIIGLKTDLQKCFRQWQNKETANEFLLGTNDIRDHLSISRNLYGRKKHVTELLKVFNRVRCGTKELILIAGYSGIGKTSLVKEIHKSIIQHHGYYIHGKFDQLQRDIPYSALVTALKNLVQQALSASEDRLEQLKQQLLSSLGNVGQVVIDVIPEVELIIGKQPQVPALSSGDAQIRFNLVFQNFIRVFTHAKHSLVMFLDDLQWADNSSLNFIENILLDKETNHLLIIGAYRDNEVNATHPLQLSIDSLNKNKVSLKILTLEPLLLENVQELLYDTLPKSQNNIQDLAHCIFAKTHGNPFFINEFLKIIHQKEILIFSYEQGSWKWDLDKIQHQSATDNVIELLTAKIDLLPKHSKELLKTGSCFGHQFDFKTLQIINDHTSSQIAEQLWQAIKANLIYPQEESYKTLGLIGLEEVTELDTSVLHYNFTHDKVQQAAYELIEEKDRPEIHLKIGRLLIKDKPLIEEDERLFEVLKHFNHSISLINDVEERLVLAQYNFWAGQKAKRASAYDAANKYLTAGIRLLKPINWEKYYDLAFQMYKELATCKYLISDFKAADRYFSILLKYANNSLDKIEIYRLKIEMLSTLGKHSEALEIGLNTLKNLGVKIPKHPSFMQILLAIFKIKFQLRTAQLETLNLPLMTDPKQRAIVDLITQLFNSAFITNQHLLVILTCKNISLSLTYGYTESTSVSIPAYAFIIMHLLNWYDEAISFVTLYNHLKQQYGDSSFEGKNQFILGAFIQPYQIPLNLCNKTIFNAFRLCCEVGDLVYSNYSNHIIIAHSLLMGKTLDEIKKNIHMTLSFMSRVKISDFLFIAQYYDYYIQCMEKPDFFEMSQLAFFEENIKKGKNKTELAFFYSTLTLFHFLLGNITEALKAGTNHELYSEHDKGLLSHFTGKFFYALSLIQYVSKLPRLKHHFYLKKLKVLNQQINKYATWCPDNFKTHSLLLAAELTYINKSQDNPLVLYEQAIATAFSSGQILFAAIASERAGAYCHTNKINKIAAIYLHNGEQYFKEWGAHTKVQLIKRTYETTLLEYTNPTFDTPTVLPKTKAPNIDMLTILKFTQLLSNEIHLDKLLQKLLVIVIENAGAQRSIILNKVNNKWVIEAEGDLDHQVIHLNSLMEEESNERYPSSILNIVQRTQKPIILNDAIKSELTFQDAYVLQEKPRSLLMMPIFYKGQLCRMLYLENKSSSHTFTSSHLDSLQLLASEAMISLENAKLYYQATHDPLTGLANRNLLYEIFQQLTQEATYTHKQIALLFLDIDYFKVINDTLGHDNGDNLLIHIAKTIKSCLRDGDIAARIGGDEFTIVLANSTSKKQITTIVEQIFREISKPVPIEDHLIQVTSSMGISIFPKDGKNIQELIKLADTALYQAKEKGRNQYHFYSTELYEEYHQTHGLDKELQRAFDKQEFFLMYQPFYNIHRDIMGFESLLRWNHPQKGVLEAEKFIHTLENSSLIIPVSEWIIKSICRQAKIWYDQKILFGTLAINISTIQFIRQSLSEITAKALTENQLASSYIEFEITETIFIEYSDKLYNEINALQKMGVNLVIDDFGTGYSNLSYLKHLPIKKIKIDKAFIHNCHNDYFDQAIIKAIVTIAHKLNLKVVAEGVENKSQQKLLKSKGVDFVQGFYYSHPLTTSECELLLKRQKIRKHT